MTAYAGNYAKTAAEIADLQIDWSPVLGTDTVATSSWGIAPAGLTQDSESETSTTATIRISGGTALVEYTLTNTVITASGQTLQQQILVLVDPTLTAQQLADLQGDLGISNDQTVFTDGELNRLYTRGGLDHDRTLVLALRQMLADATKLHDFSAGSTSESLSQVRANLEKLLNRWETIAGMGSGGRLRAGKIKLGIDEPYPTYGSN